MVQQPHPLLVGELIPSPLSSIDEEDSWNLEYEMPEPGKPNVERVPCLPKLIVAPGPPTDVDIPDLLKFSLTPGNSLTEFRNLQPMTTPDYCLDFTISREKPIDSIAPHVSLIS